MDSFTSVRDLVDGFANAMNLINPEVQNHHEKVAYLAYQLADQMGLDEQLKRLTYYGALTHDIGSVMKGQNLSLMDLEMDAKRLAQSSALLLRMFPFTNPFSDVVQNSQTPWQKLMALSTKFKNTYAIGQIIHMADAVSLMLNDREPVLNQLAAIKYTFEERSDAEFSPDVVQAFEGLCQRESVWMDLLYNSERFLEMIPSERWLTLDDTIRFTEFMSKIIDFRSPFTAMHSAGVAAAAVCLAERMGMSEDECKMMRIAGNLHDVGKMKIPNAILEKPGKLTDEEFNIMKEHTYYTYMILRDIRGFEQISKWAAFHHEKLTGAGYPFHLSAAEIPLGSRIMAVADIFSAITGDRPYRKGMEKEKVISILRGDAAKGLISGRIVETLVGDFDAINAVRERESIAASRKYQETLKG